MKTFKFLLGILLTSFSVFSQNTELRSDRITVPKMNTSAKNAMTSKVEGNMVYDTDLKQFSYWTGTAWVNFGNTVSAGTGWQQTGNDISNTNSGKVGIGLTSPPRAKIEVSSSVTTQAIFGAVSIMQNWPTIGFNVYMDESNTVRYTKDGSGGGMYMNPNGDFWWYTLPSNGLANQPTGPGNNAIGITRQGALTFPNLLGNKITLWKNGPNNEFGIGIKSGTMALYTAGFDKISFGNGNADTFNEVLKIETGTGGVYSSQTPNINIVPLGVSKVWASETANGLSSSSSYENIVGTMVVESFDISNINIDDRLSGRFRLNPSIVAQCSRIIAIGSKNYTGGSIVDINPAGIPLFNDAVSGFIGEIFDGIYVITTGTNPGTYYNISVIVDDFPLTGGSSISSNVIFYGIK